LRNKGEKEGEVKRKGGRNVKRKISVVPTKRVNRGKWEKKDEVANRGKKGKGEKNFHDGG